MTFRDRLKYVKRVVRTYAVKLLLQKMEKMPASAYPKLTRLLLKVFPLIWKKELKLAEQNLPEEFSENKSRILRLMLEDQVRSVLEVIFYEKLLAEDPNFVTVEGKEFLEEAKRQHKGIIILTGHYGSWEVLGYTLVKLGLELTVLARAQAISQMTDLMNGYRIRRGMKVLMENTIPNALADLKAGKAVAVLADLDAKEHGCQVDFFGKKASFYSSPVLLEARSKSVILPVFAVRGQDGHVIIRFEKPLNFAKGESMISRVQKCASVYENVYRRAPEFWCWFHKRYEFAHLGKIK